MTRKLKSGEEITSIGIKHKTLAVFQVLRLLTNKSHVEVLEQIGEAIDPVVAHYINEFSSQLGKKPVNLEVTRKGFIVQIGLIPKLEVKTRKEGEPYEP